METRLKFVLSAIVVIFVLAISVPTVISQETLPPIGEGPPSASSYDTETGITTASRRNPDGSRTVTRTDEDGNIISQETLPPIGDDLPFLPPFLGTRSYDPDTGVTTTVKGNPDGSRTFTVADKDGNIILQHTTLPPIDGLQAWTSPYNPDTGITTGSHANPDGSRTFTVTDKDGNIILQRTALPSFGDDRPWTNSYDPDTGITTTMQEIPAGSRTFTRTDKDGNIISQLTVPPSFGEGPGATCYCMGYSCECPREDYCQIQFLRLEVQRWSRHLIDAAPGSEEAREAMEARNAYREGLEEAERKCNKPGAGGTGVATDEPPPEDTPCSCKGVGYNCVCREASACGGARPDSFMSILLPHEWVCVGATGRDTGVAIDVTPPEAAPACSCGGDNCKCHTEDYCGVQLYSEMTQYWSVQIMDAPPGSQWARKTMKAWNSWRKKMEAAEKKCK